MDIDHIFIFSNQGNETDELVDLGLTEGSARRHKGIGTANRRIFFDNFYLEILWVEDEAEAKSVEKIGILERSRFARTGYSRFGVCLKNTEDTDAVFENSHQWRPDFLTSEGHVNILTSDKSPWIFRFPKDRGGKNRAEPRNHAAKIHRLTKVDLWLRELDFEERLSLIAQNSALDFRRAPEEMLVLEFDGGVQRKEKLFKSLNLKIVY